MVADLVRQPVCVAEFEAWSSGPVNRTLINAHAGELEVSVIAGGDSDRVSAAGHDIVHILHQSYAGMTGPMLAELSRRGGPWDHVYTVHHPIGKPTPTLPDALIRAQFTGLWAERIVRFPQPR